MARGNKSKEDARKYEAAQRREQALRLRLAGATYEEIGKHFGVNKSTAKRWIDRSIEKAEKDTSDELVALENMRLDVAQRAIMPNVAKGSYGAVDRLLKIMERRARLNGLDAPQRLDLTAEPVDIDEVVRDLMKVMAEQGEPEEPPEEPEVTGD